jgi:hypothetical protein
MFLKIDKSFLENYRSKFGIDKFPIEIALKNDCNLGYGKSTNW